MSTPSHKGFVSFAREKYSREILALIRGFVVTSKRIVTQRQHLAFNSRCKRYQLIPKFLRIKALVPSYDGERIAQCSSRQFLCALIEHNHRVTRRLELDLRHRRQILEESLQKEDLTVLELLCFEAQHAQQEKCRTRQKRKFDALLRNVQEWKCQEARENASRHAKWVVNLSSRTLSSAEKNVLSKGLNFAPAPCKIPTAHMVGAVESGLRCLPEEVAEPARNKIIGAINKARPSPVNMLPQERHTIKSLQRDDSILVLPADKRRAMVVMDVVEYDREMNSLLTDSKTYKRLTTDPTPSLEWKMNEMLLQLKKSGSITSGLYDRLRPSAGSTRSKSPSMQEAQTVTLSNV